MTNSDRSSVAESKFNRNVSFNEHSELNQNRVPMYRAERGRDYENISDRCRLFVGNLPQSCTDEDLKSLFESYGEVKEVFFNYQKGFAFVKMDSPQSAEAAVSALDFTLRKGRRLRVTFAVNAKSKLIDSLGPTTNLRTKDEKPGGRCRLFVGNLPSNLTEEDFKKWFEEYGEVSEVFLNSEKGFGFVKMNCHQSAEDAKSALDNTFKDGKHIQVRFATQGTCLQVKNLTPWVSNELLETAFSIFGEVERAIVVVDDRGRPCGEGVVEFSRKQSAQIAMKKCNEGCFLLTSSPCPVAVEPLEYKDDDLGMPEKNINKKSKNYHRERELGPRFAKPGTYEFEVAMRWKQFFDFEKEKRDQLEKEISEEKKKLEEEVERYRQEHQAEHIREQLHLAEGMNRAMQREDHCRPPLMMNHWGDPGYIQDQYASYMNYETGYLGPGYPGPRGGPPFGQSPAQLPPGPYMPMHGRNNASYGAPKGHRGQY